MKANETMLIELIGVRKRVFSIPVYQRNYDWKADNCKQLFFDIQRIAETGKDHFLGTIVYIQDRSTATCPIFIIIDGQQRITSVMLFIKALHDSIDDADIRADIEEDYLRNRGGSDYRLKLKPIESDQNVFEKLMMQDEFEEEEFSSQEKQTAIYRNYDYFKKMISDSEIPATQLYEAVFRLEIVEIQLDKENPQEIFESLNSTGLDLSNADLLRNYLLMSLSYEKQQELYKKYWLVIERMLGNEQIEPFMTYYIILKKKSDALSIDGKRAHINSVNLYRSYKMWITDEGRRDEDYLEQLLSDMKKYASYYQHFVKHVNDDDDCFNDKHKELFTQFNSPAIAIILMYFYDLMNEGKITKNDYEQALDVCISFLFRARVAGHNVGAQFCALLIQYYERSETASFIDRVWEAFNCGKGTYNFPSDSEFKNDLQTKDLYLSLRSAGVRYLLYKLEENLSKEVVTSENATIEHIMPQTLSEKWRRYLSEKQDKSYDLYIHRLGNLTLTKENSKLSNNLFSEKLNEYEESNYKITRRLTKYNEWTSKEIQQRSELLSEMATEIWPLPARFNDAKEAVRSTSGMMLTLEDDYDQFTGTKPSSAIFLDEYITVDSWIDAYCEIHKRMYKLAPNAYPEYFKTDDNVNELIISNSESEFSKSYELDEGIYLNISFRKAKRLMKKLRIFMDYYAEQNDVLSDEISNDLVFELA